MTELLAGWQRTISCSPDMMKLRTAQTFVISTIGEISRTLKNLNNNK
jgi:hypothetical protein